MSIDDLPHLRPANLAQIEQLAALLQHPPRVDYHPPAVDSNPPWIMIRHTM